MTQPLLTTKLYAPKITDRHVMRTSLVKRLLDGIHAGKRLSMVCAPAGYGKTTLVLEVLKEMDSDSGWISLDEGDNDAGRFLAYLTAALRKAGVRIGNDIDSLIADFGFNTTDTILTMLINCVADCSDLKILTFDDYHVIRLQKINEIMKFLLEHQPSNLHLIIISREDPQLPIARMRIDGSLTETRMGDLLFSTAEASELFSRIMELEISSDAVDKITSRTEGWIAGLQLAGLLLKSYGDGKAEDYIRKFDGTNSYIIDYLVEEVLGHLEPDIRNFLCKTSILERMNSLLCNELTDRTDSREILQRIEKANLFLIPLDEKREWYRYHHLFADSLKTNLSPAEEQNLYKKASAWMKSNGFSAEAVRYAFKSKDMALAVKMVEDSVEETFREARLESLVKWLEQIPGDLVINSEVLSVRKALAYFITGRFREALEYMAFLTGEFERNASSHNKGLLLSLRAMVAAASNQDAEPLAREALGFLEPWDPISRTSALNSLGRAQYKKGKIPEAMETFKCAYESGLKIGYQFVTTLALMNYSSCLGAMGKSDEALELCNRYIKAMEGHFDSLPPYVGILYVTMAELLEVSDKAQEAVKLREEGVALCKAISYDGSASLKIFSESKTEKSTQKDLNKNEVNDTGKNTVQENPERLLEFGEKLSEREAEILKLIGNGLSNQDIAKALYISLNTTQWHISHIYSKLGVKSRTQAILKAKETGIL